MGCTFELYTEINLMYFSLNNTLKLVIWTELLVWSFLIYVCVLYMLASYSQFHIIQQMLLLNQYLWNTKAKTLTNFSKTRIWILGIIIHLNHSHGNILMSMVSKIHLVLIRLNNRNGINLSCSHYRLEKNHTFCPFSGLNVYLLS